MSTNAQVKPPLAKRIPHVHELHGDRRVDEYAWLRDRDDPAVIAYLEAENAYTEAHTSKELEERLFQEIKDRIQETDMSAPLPEGAFDYYTRTVEGSQYAIHCRRPRGGGDEHVLLDDNALAAGHAYFRLGGFATSPDHRLLAYATDFDGDEVYTLRFRDLDTGEDLPDEVPGVYYGLAWASDNETLFYTTLDDAKRPWRLHRHRLGTAVTDDVVVHQEDDPSFYVSVWRSRSDRFVYLHLGSMVTTEVRFLDASDPAGGFRTIEPRRHDIEYSVEDQDDVFLILTNDDAENFRLMRAPVSSPGRASWSEMIAHRPGVKLDGLDAFANHVVVEERELGQQRLRVIRVSDGDDHVIEQPEPVYTVATSTLEYDTPVLRFVYTSLVTPRSDIDYDMDARTRAIVKQQPVLGGFDTADYESQRLWATAPDGVRVPISLVQRRDRAPGGPLLLAGYGAYEASSDPVFSPARLSLLDRGFAFAIAHVRGGGELGRAWYENGKFLHKRNTFTDFIACAEQLIAEGRTTAANLAIRGGSAGGLLMGAVVNLRPDLFGAVVAQVPFVDVLTTILDESLPLSVLEWEEWGNPNDPEFYRYMRTYSPYDNVEAKAYPPMLVTAGLNDPRVSYWEPAKWVARLRASKTDDTILLLKTQMGAGHGGPSGRYEAWREEASTQAFILGVLGR